MSGDVTPRIRALLDDHARAVDELIGRAMAVPDGAWHLPRAEGKWSPAQEVRHIVLSYDAFNRELGGREGMRLVGSPARRLLWRAIGLTSMLWLRRIPRGARAPREARPGDESAGREELILELRRAVADFEAAYRLAIQSVPDRTVTHPYFGALSLLQGLKVCSVHTRHHAAALPPTASTQRTRRP